MGKREVLGASTEELDMLSKELREAHALVDLAAVFHGAKCDAETLKDGTLGTIMFMIEERLTGARVVVDALKIAEQLGGNQVGGGAPK